MDDYLLMALSLVVQLGSAVAAWLYMIRMCQDPEVTRQKKLDLPCLICAVVAFAGSVYVLTRGFPYGDDNFMRAFMNAEVFIWLVTLGYIDLKKKIIPNAMILLGLAFWAVLFLIDILAAGNNWLDVLVFSGTGGLLCGGVLLVIALIVKTALGMGDVKMFFVLGLLYGLTDTYSILLFSMVLMAVISLVLLIAKKVTTKTAVPMAPFVAAGFLLSIIAGM